MKEMAMVRIAQMKSRCPETADWYYNLVFRVHYLAPENEVEDDSETPTCIKFWFL